MVVNWENKERASKALEDRERETWKDRTSKAKCDLKDGNRERRKERNSKYEKQKK